MSRSKGDYSLYRLGTFDADSSDYVIVAEDKPFLVIPGSDL
jgi:hypothetical protein